jgi:hypothetical protein
MKIAIITALCGNRETLVNPPIVHRDVDYYAYVDAVWPNANVWKQISLEKRYTGDKYSDRRNAKYYKILPHRYLENYDYWIWTDVSHSVIMNPIKIINEYMKDADIGVFRHTQRNCAYDEAKVLKELGYDHIDLIDKQISFYENEGLPKNFGLFELPVSVRKNNKSIRDFNELWWNQIETYSSRDQLSFPYCLFKSMIEITIFPGYANGFNPDGTIGRNILIPQTRHHVSSGG